MKTTRRIAALAAVGVLALAACGEPPAEEPTADPTETETETEEPPVEEVDFTGCIVSDQGGFDDRSFNQAGYEGLMRAVDELGIDHREAESSAETDFAPNINSMIGEGCDLIFTVGFLLGDATTDAAEANPDFDFAIIDEFIEADNVKPILFNTAEAAFLAGYLAAGFTTTGTVATYGGIPIPPVTIFMDGFVDGVAHYNETHGTSVEALGWDKDAQDGSFVGNFEDQAAGQNLTRSFIDAGADVILPVAGPVGLGTAAAAQEADGVVFIGVDADWVETAPEYADVTLTSILKQMGPAVFDVLSESVDGAFSNEPYVGTLDNEGVALSPFHEFDGEVSDELKAELEQLLADIVSGTVVVESPASP